MSASAFESRMKSQAKWAGRLRFVMLGLVVIQGVFEAANHFDWWDVNGNLLGAGRIAVLVGAAVESGWGIARKSRWDEHLKVRDEINKILIATVLAASKTSGVDVDVLGCNAWSIERPKRKAEEFLYRRGSFRLSGFPSPSSFTWVRGKGVIGRCWEKNEVVYKDFRPSQIENPEGVAPSKDQWKRMSSAEKWGCERKEYSSAVWRYSQIIAVPFGGDQGIRGCLSLDIPTARATDLTIDLAEVRELLSQSGRSVYSLMASRGMV